MDRPNIVLMMTDQQRWDTLRFLGFEHMVTPNLDRLARRGIAFSHAFTQGAVCGPSRNSIVSGQYVHTHGVEYNEAWLAPGQPNWIGRLRDGGYHTVNIGKMHTAPIRLLVSENGWPFRRFGGGAAPPPSPLSPLGALSHISQSLTDAPPGLSLIHI